MIKQTPLHRSLLMVTAIIAAFVADHAYSEVHVKGYYRKDGTYVRPHYRSDPDGIFGNNWSTKGNINPHTGEYGTRVTPPVGSGASYTGNLHLGSSALRRQTTEYASSGLTVDPHDAGGTSLPPTSPEPLSDKLREVATMNYHGVDFFTTHLEFLRMFPNAKTAWPVDSVGLHSYAIDDLDGKTDAIWFQFLDNQLYCLGFTYSEDRVRDYGGKAVLLDRATQRFGPPTGEQSATTMWLFPSIDRTVAAGLDGSRWCMLVRRTSLQEKIDRKKIQLDANQSEQRGVHVVLGQDGDNRDVEVSEGRAKIVLGAKLVQAANGKTETLSATVQGETHPDAKRSSRVPSVREEPKLVAEKIIETGLATEESPSPVANPLTDRITETQEETQSASKKPKPKEGWVYWRPTEAERAEMEAEAKAAAIRNRKTQPTNLQITPRGLLVTREQYGDEWPFTVPEGFVESIDYAIVFHTREGKTYALNGIAMERDYLDIEPIWRPHPVYKGMKISVGPLIDAGIRTRTGSQKNTARPFVRSTSKQVHRKAKSNHSGSQSTSQAELVANVAEVSIRKTARQFLPAVREAARLSVTNNAAAERYLDRTIRKHVRRDPTLTDSSFAANGLCQVCFDYDDTNLSGQICVTARVDGYEDVSVDMWPK